MDKQPRLIYEELHEEIANLRAKNGLQNNKILDLQAQIDTAKRDVMACENKYDHLLNESFEIFKESNKTIAKLVENLSGDRTW